MENQKLLLSVTRSLGSSIVPVVRVTSASICASDTGSRAVVVRRAEALHRTADGVEIPSSWPDGVWGRDTASAISTVYTGDPADFVDVSPARYAGALLGSAFAVDYCAYVGDLVSDGRYGLFAAADWAGALDGSGGDLTVSRVGFCASGFAWSDFLARANEWYGVGGGPSGHRALYVTAELVLGDVLRRVVVSCDYASSLSWIRRGAIWSAAPDSAGAFIGRWECDGKARWLDLPGGDVTSYRLCDHATFQLPAEVAAAPVHFV